MSDTHENKIWELSAAKIHNEAAPEEEKELKHLLKEDADNEKAFHSINEINKNLSSTGFLQNVSVNHSWKTINRYLQKKERRLYLNIFKYAAIILLAFLLGVLINNGWKGNKAGTPLFAEIHVPLGQMSEMILHDGTHVWLNSGTTLSYSAEFGKEIRKVKLEGEAFFKVKEGEIPFVVELKKNEIEVLGTSFSAISYPEDDFSRVTLVEGLVQINHPDGRPLANINPKQQINIPDNPMKTATIREVNTLFYESWIEGKIQFDEEFLADVARRMERWYNVEIKFTSEEAKKLRFSGTVLKNKPIDQSIKAMSLLLPIEVRYENNLADKDVITISKK